MSRPVPVGSEASFPSEVTEEDRRGWMNRLGNAGPLAAASAETLERLASQAVFSRAPAGRALLRAEDPIEGAYFLIEGVLRVFQARQGQEYTPKLLSAPSHFGELALLAGLPTHRSAIEALTPVVFARIPALELERALADDSALCHAWLYSLARQFAVTVDCLKQNVFGGVPSRVANVLLAYAEVFGREVEPGWTELGYPLSYADLARQVACTRRGVIKVMNALVAEQAVRSTPNGWWVQRAQLNDELLPERLSLHYALDDNKAPRE